MDERLTTMEAAEYLATVLLRPPSLHTLMCYARPAYKRFYPRVDMPATAGKRGRLIVWSRKELDAWVARKRQRAEERSKRKKAAAPPEEHLLLADVVRILEEQLPPAAVPAAGTLLSWARPSGRARRAHLDLLLPRLRAGKRHLYRLDDVNEWIERRLAVVPVGEAVQC